MFSLLSVPSLELEKYAISLSPINSFFGSNRPIESRKEKVLEVQDNERKGPQGSSRALGREAWRNKVPFFVRKKSACHLGSQVIEEPCVSGEGSSSIRRERFLPIFTDFYRFLPTFTDFYLVSLPSVLFTS